jgi:hypothetical protein
MQGDKGSGPPGQTIVLQAWIRFGIRRPCRKRRATSETYYAAPYWWGIIRAVWPVELGTAAAERGEDPRQRIPHPDDMVLE